MRRTNIYLSEAEQQALDARAAVEGCTRSDIVRSVLDRDLNLDEQTEIDAAFGELAAELADAARALSADDPDLSRRLVVIVDDHLSLLAIAGRLPDLMADGPVVTTWGFQFRMARAVADSSRRGSLSRRIADPDVPLRRYLRPPANRLIVLDPRVSADQSVRIAVEHRANLLLAELAGSAVHYGAAVRLTAANVGRMWPTVMQTEGIDLATVQP